MVVSKDETFGLTSMLIGIGCCYP